VLETKQVTNQSFLYLLVKKDNACFLLLNT